MDVILSAILPPSNVSREITLLQKILFSKYGLISAFALPPLIPLGYHPISFSEQDFSHATAHITHAFRVSLGQFCLEKNSLFISVNTNGEWQTLRQQLNVCTQRSSLNLPATTALSIYEGIFLSLNEQKCVDFVFQLDDLSRLIGFSAQTLAFLQIRSAEKNWWNEVFWTVRFEKKN